jgi:hypothetical protein
MSLNKPLTIAFDDSPAERMAMARQVDSRLGGLLSGVDVPDAGKVAAVEYLNDRLAEQGELDAEDVGEVVDMVEDVTGESPYLPENYLEDMSYDMEIEKTRDL